MNKKILCLALLGAMGAAQTVMAQDYDDRWYIDGSAGFNFQDKHRDNNNAPFVTLGFGKLLSPTWGAELNFNYQRPREVHPDSGMFWKQEGASLDVLYHFADIGQMDPYLRAGLGWQRNSEGFFDGAVPAKNNKSNLAADLGFGLEAKYGRYNVRSEVGARFDFDSESVNSPNSSFFVDYLASVGVTVALGPQPMKAVEPTAPPPAPAVTCADKDSDGDGVNDCNDKCPNTPSGTTVGPDGCPVPVTIDLRGVNFDFDKSKLRPDAVEILVQAVEVLKKYPEMKVEVAGHTDSIGTDAYNQKLSERRAKAVYDYLTSNGIDAGRLIGPHGYGKTRPIAPNTNPDGTDNPQGRAQNRRTELNVQN
jgi:OOP family OmpA-OmpF porin